MTSPSSSSGGSIPSVYEIDYLESFSIPELINYLQVNNKSPSAFKKLEKVLVSKQQKLERDFESCKADLQAERNHLETYKDMFQGELEELETSNEARLKEFKDIVSERERIAMLRIQVLEQEVAQLNAENRDLRRAKRRAEDEIEAKNKRLKMVATKAANLARGFSECLGSRVLGNSNLEVEVGSGVSSQEEEQIEPNGASSWNKSKFDVRSSSCDGNLLAAGGGGDSICHSSVQGQPIPDLLRKPLVGSKEQRSLSSVFDVANELTGRKKNVLQLTECSYKKLDSPELSNQRSVCGSAVETIDRDNEVEAPKENLSSIICKTRSLNQKGEGNGSRCEDKQSSVSSLK